MVQKIWLIEVREAKLKKGSPPNSNIEKHGKQAGAELCQAQPQAVLTGCPLANDQN